MAINVKYIVLFIFLSISLLASIIMNNFAASSMMLGTLLLSSMLFIVYILKPIKISISKHNMTFFLISLFWVYCVSTLSAMNNPFFDYWRFIGSYLLLIVFFFLAFLLVLYLEKTEPIIFAKTANSIFYLLLFDGIYSTIKHMLLDGKKTIFFSEPSHFALAILPFFLYKILSNKQTQSSNFIIVLAMVMIALFIENLTLLIGILLSFFIISKFKYFLSLLSILVLFTVFSPIINLDYFLSRLTFSGEIRNLSILVFLSGWERALLNFQNTYGLGIGLNQLGYIGTLGDFQEILSNLGMAKLNLYDGGSTGSKLISELGLFGLFFVLIFLFFVFKFYFLIRKYIIFLDSKDIFFLSVFIMFTIELFIRGVGFFSQTVFLCMASIFYINRVTYQKIKEIHVAKI